MDIGIKIAQARREQGITQIELADQLSVTRQTVSRWETGTAFPDIETVASLAEILQVSCDYLLRDLPSERNVVPATGNTETSEQGNSITKLLSSIEGKNVRITFYDDEEDMDVWDKVCKVDCFEGNWIRVTVQQESETHKTKRTRKWSFYTLSSPYFTILAPSQMTNLLLTLFLSFLHRLCLIIILENHTLYLR